MDVEPIEDRSTLFTPSEHLVTPLTPEQIVVRISLPYDEFLKCQTLTGKALVVIAMGCDVFGEANFLTWLASPAPAFAGELPIYKARSVNGLTELMHVIGRIEHGVYF